MKVIEEAIEVLKALPGVGNKTATRFVFYFLKEEDEKVEKILEKVKELKTKLRKCSQCHSFSEFDPCKICSSPDRDASILCVVEDMQKLYFLEKNGIFLGKYHILGGLLSPLKGINYENLNIKSLLERIKKEPIKEVILALSPTIEGLTTTRYLENLLKEYDLKVSELAKGLNVGEELDWVDEATLRLALEGRVIIKK